MVGGCQAQNGRFVVFFGGIEDIDAIDAIDAIEAIEAIEDGLLGMWAWWDGREQKVGWRGCEG